MLVEYLLRGNAISLQIEVSSIYNEEGCCLEIADEGEKCVDNEDGGGRIKKRRKVARTSHGEEQQRQTGFVRELAG